MQGDFQTVLFGESEFMSPDRDAMTGPKAGFMGRRKDRFD